MKIKKTIGQTRKPNGPAWVPDFLLIPYTLITDDHLSLHDKMVYGAIYMYARLAKHHCIASNREIARIIRTSERTVRRALKSLETHKYIQRIFVEKHRKEIIPLIQLPQIPLLKLKRGEDNTVQGEDNTVPPNGQKEEVDVFPTEGQKTIKNSTTKLQNPQKGINQGEDKDGHRITISIYTNTKDIVSSETKSRNNYSDQKKEKNQLVGKNIVSAEKIQEHKELDMSIDTVAELPSQFKNRLKNIKKFSSIGAIPEMLVNEILAFFLPIFPEQFIKEGNPFNIPATRKVVKHALMTLTPDEIKRLIVKYADGGADIYRPVAANIYAFCGFKLAKIKAWAQKPSGELHSQRSMSTLGEQKLRNPQYEKTFQRIHNKSKNI